MKCSRLEGGGEGGREVSKEVGGMDGHGPKNGEESDAGQVRSTNPARSPCQGKARYLPLKRREASTHG